MDKIESKILTDIIDYCIHRMDSDDLLCDRLLELSARGDMDSRLMYCLADRLRFENRRTLTDIIKIVSAQINNRKPP